MPELEPGRARRGLRRHERDARAAAFASIRRRSGSPTSAAARTTSRARSSAGRSSTAPRETETIDEMERLIDWLPEHLPPPAPVAAGARRLPARQHDPRARREPHVLAVLDWELSTLGDPLADFTYHLMKWHMPPTDTGAGTGTLVGLDLAGARHPDAARLRRRLCGAHRARSAAASAGLSRLQLLPHRRDPTRASSAACATAPRPARTPPPRRRWCGRSPPTAWRVRRKRRAHEELRARARRRRRARARAYRGDRGARRDGRQAGRDRRHLDRRADRRGLRGRHDRPGDAPPRASRSRTTAARSSAGCWRRAPARIARR